MIKFNPNSSKVNTYISNYFLFPAKIPTQLRRSQVTKDSFSLEVNSKQIETHLLNLLVQNISLTVCSFKDIDCKNVKSDKNFIVIEEFTPATCYSISYEINLLWNITSLPTSSKKFCTAIEKGPYITSAGYLNRQTLIAINSGLPHQVCNYESRRNLDQSCNKDSSKILGRAS